MFPVELVAALRPHLAGRILVDVQDGREAADLAALCGRAIHGVYYILRSGVVMVALEPPVFADEPEGIAVQAAEVTNVEVHGGRFRQAREVVLVRERDPLRLWVTGMDGRIAYELEALRDGTPR